ncbi:MAG: acyl carrier protein [Nocardioidaceae bacterium]
MDLDEGLRQAISRVCGVAEEDVRPESTLEELGVDSLAAAEMITDLEIRLGRDLPMDVLRQLAGLRTVGEVADALRATLGGPVSPTSP